jgi:hypothetical protein
MIESKSAGCFGVVVTTRLNSSKRNVRENLPMHGMLSITLTCVYIDDRPSHLYTSGQGIGGKSDM